MTAVNIIQEMRNWLADCEWQDVDEDEIQSLPARQIIAAVENHYDGGKAQFMRDFEPIRVHLTASERTRLAKAYQALAA